MNPIAKSHLIRRIHRATTLTRLRQIWEGINPEYQRDPVVQEAKDAKKRELGG